MYLMYVDESGSTGLDLENKNQPFFVLSGVRISDNSLDLINEKMKQLFIKN